MEGKSTLPVCNMWQQGETFALHDSTSVLFQVSYFFNPSFLFPIGSSSESKDI